MASRTATATGDHGRRHTDNREFPEMTTLSAEDFWTFSLDFYGKQNVAKDMDPASVIEGGTHPCLNKRA